MVPKTVMHFLVNGFRDGLQNELVAQLYRESTLSELMRETEDVAARRKAALEMKELLQRALDIVNEVSCYFLYSFSCLSNVYLFICKLTSTTIILII
jgi:hypothetical protein